MWLLCLLLMVGGIQGERFPHLDKPSWLDPGWTPLVHDGRYRLSGRVFWADTGQGQKGVVLAARSEGRGLVFRSVTGADGVFVFCDVPAGIYKLDPMLFWASCPPSASAYPGGLPVLRAAAERTGLVCQVGIPLVRGIPVYGRVLGPDGRTPVVQARVLAMVVDGGRIVQSRYRPLEYPVDVLGCFRIPGLGGEGLARGILVANAPGFGNVMQEVRLDPDHPPRCSLVLGRGPVRVRGHVLDASSGKPIPGAKVWIHGLKQSLALAREGRAIADGSGCFEILGIGSEGGAVLSVLADESAGGGQHVLPQDGSPKPGAQGPPKEAEAPGRTFAYRGKGGGPRPEVAGAVRCPAGPGDKRMVLRDGCHLSL